MCRAIRDEVFTAGLLLDLHDDCSEVRGHLPRDKSVRCMRECSKVAVL